MAAFLIPTDLSDSPIPLEKPIILIGRQSECDFHLTQSRKVSRRHCCVAQVNNHYVIRDLGSTNGVYLNGVRIRREAMLSFGDELTSGDLHFHLQKELPPSSAVPKRIPTEPKIDEELNSFKDPLLSLDLPIQISEDSGFKRASTMAPDCGPRRRDDVIPLNENTENKDEMMRLASDPQ